MSKLGNFLIWSTKDTYKQLEHYPQVDRLVATFIVTLAHFLHKGVRLPHNIVVRICFGIKI